ncbi:MAG: hypothetical protein WBP22_05000 [Candidatus Saccharimonas sp.]
MLALAIISAAVAQFTVFAGLLLRIQVSIAVRGSYRKYMLSSALVLTHGIQIAALSVFAVANALMGQLPYAVGAILLATVSCVLLKQALKDDNWFNDAGKRLKKRLRSLASLRVHVPRTALNTSL